MRIVGGTFRGRNIISPEGLTTRPTSDRARQAIFNILHHASWRDGDVLTDAAVLDLFAGTGAMGLEALSQGAQHAVFIEQDAKALKACRDNIAAFGVTGSTKIINGNALAPLSRPADLAPRSLVFLDPPYAKDFGTASLVAAAQKNWLAPQAVIVMEMAKKQPEIVPPGFTLHDTRDYGVARVMFMTYTGS